MKGFIGFVIGLVGGLLGGLLGIGGGIVMIPLMKWLAKLTQHQAHGTSLFAIVFTAFMAAGTYSMHGDVNWKVALILALSAIVTARFGALFAHSLPEKKLTQAFGIFLVFASIMLLAKGYLPKAGFTLSSWTSIGLILLIGSFTGFLSGMMGVGGGVLMVPLMVILGSMEQHMAQGTSLLAMAPASMSGAITHYRLGNVQTDIAWGLAAGALAGGYVGATTATALPEIYLRVVFALLGLWMSLRYLRG